MRKWKPMALRGAECIGLGGYELGDGANLTIERASDLAELDAAAASAPAPVR